MKAIERQYMDGIRRRIMWKVNQATIEHLKVAVKNMRLSEAARERARRMLLTAITIRERGRS